MLSVIMLNVVTPYLAVGKHSSLLARNVSDEEKMFCDSDFRKMTFVVGKTPSTSHCPRATQV
jgi:hypothetical protein